MDDDAELWRDLESLENEELCGPDCSCPGCELLNIPDDHSYPQSDEEEEPHNPPQIEHARRKKAALQGHDLVPKIHRILEVIRDEGLTISIFLDAISWGDERCTADDRIRFARAGLLMSEELPGIVSRWYKPPRNKNKGRRPAGARRTLETFATECVANLIDREMEGIAPLFSSPPSEVSEAHLTSFDFKSFAGTIKHGAPLVWKLITQLSHTRKQQQRNTQKNPDMVVLHQISQAQYTRSHHRSRIAKLWSIYLQACGLSARAADALHRLGHVMSHKWTANAYATLAEHAMQEVQADTLRLPWIISHDNVNLPMRVFSQRLHNQSHFLSGCAATVWVLPHDAALPRLSNPLLRTHRAEGSKERFCYADLLDGDVATHQRIRNLHVYHVLRFLVESPAFSDYKEKADKLFHYPQPVRQLAHGQDRTVRQRILRTIEQEEASYEGNDKAMENFFHQLGLGSEEEKRKTGEERVIVWIGDQLTVERLRGLFRYRYQDFNSFDRMDYMIPMFGWFHLVMAFANSLHKQYLGGSAIIGSLQQAFDLLQRKGLQKPETKGPFWHHLHEALYHVGEAHIRASWIAVSGATSIEDLKMKSPCELYDLAEKLVENFASRKALGLSTGYGPSQDLDTVLSQWTMFNSDILSYIELTTAIKYGDVGTMEDLLPTLLFRFAGGGNSKYAIEVLELIQGLRCEWPDKVKNYVRDHCWLINRSGKPDGFTPIDKAQEQNIGDIKVTYHSFGPGATFDYLHKISPAIPTLRAVQRHMELEFETVSRGSRHGAPDKEPDVAMLTTHYIKSQIHINIPGRQLKGGTKYKAADFITSGSIDLERLGTLDSWWQNRTFVQSTTEIWD